MSRKPLGLRRGSRSSQLGHLPTRGLQSLVHCGKPEPKTEPALTPGGLSSKGSPEPAVGVRLQGLRQLQLRRKADHLGLLQRPSVCC